MRLSTEELEALRQTVVAMKRCQRECGGDVWEPYIAVIRSLVRRLTTASPAGEVTDKAVKVVARRLCTRDGVDPDATATSYANIIDESWPEWRDREDEAREILTAALDRKDHE